MAPTWFRSPLARRQARRWATAFFNGGAALIHPARAALRCHALETEGKVIASISAQGKIRTALFFEKAGDDGAGCPSRCSMKSSR
jgi:hypothetical protein